MVLGKRMNNETEKEKPQMRAKNEVKSKKKEHKSEELTSTSSEVWSVSRMKAERALSEYWRNLKKLKNF